MKKLAICALILTLSVKATVWDKEVAFAVLDDTSINDEAKASKLLQTASSAGIEFSQSRLERVNLEVGPLIGKSAAKKDAFKKRQEKAEAVVKQNRRHGFDLMTEAVLFTGKYKDKDRAALLFALAKRAKESEQPVAAKKGWLNWWS